MLVTGCTHDGIQGVSTAGSSSTSPVLPSSSSGAPSATATTKTTVSDPVKGTTFDACSVITDADVAPWWGVKPAKRDAHKTAFGQNVRGCIWDGPRWGIKIYAVNTPISVLEQPNGRFDRQEPVQVGSRMGWLLHDKNWIGCAIGIPSQQGVAAVQVDLNLEETQQHLDQCPLALRIMTQIEPKIP
ncbi:DUF3558 family protein [Mycobacteroides salmoniphilum]|nr:DUF3558 family protein [Mycobacteroides salmoniphilum]